MCSKEDVEKAIDERVPEIVKREIIEFIPMLIGKAFKEFQGHLKMSDDTRKELNLHSVRILKLENMFEENKKFHERIEPILIKIEKGNQFKTGIYGFVTTSGVLAGSLLAIGSFISGIVYISVQIFGK